MLRKLTGIKFKNRKIIVGKLHQIETRLIAVSANANRQLDDLC